MADIKKISDESTVFIKPGIGFKNLRFGMNRSEVTKVLGKPETIEIERTRITKMLSLYYFKRTLEFDFSIDDQFKLGGITVYPTFNNGMLFYKDKNLLKLDKDQIINFLAKSESDYRIDEIEPSYEEGFEGFKILYFDYLSLTFYFTYNWELFENVFIYPLYDKNDKPIWPKRNLTLT